MDNPVSWGVLVSLVIIFSIYFFVKAIREKEKYEDEDLKFWRSRDVFLGE